MNAIESGILTSKSHPTIFYELDRLLLESIISNKEVVLCDMPEALMRWQIANTYSLDEMVEIFNTIMNKIEKGQGPL